MPARIAFGTISLRIKRVRTPVICIGLRISVDISIRYFGVKSAAQKMLHLSKAFSGYDYFGKTHPKKSYETFYQRRNIFFERIVCCVK